MIIFNISRRSMGLPLMQGQNNTRLNICSNSFYNTSHNVNVNHNNNTNNNRNRYTKTIKPSRFERYTSTQLSNLIRSFKTRNTRATNNLMNTMSSVMGTTGATSSSSSLLRQRPTYLFTHNSNRDNTTNTLRNTEFTKSNRVHFNLRRNNILMMHKQQRPRDKFIMGSRSLTYQQRQDLKNSCPIISHMPFINLNSSVFVMNTSPFGLTDPRFGILHHFSPSRSYI